MNVVIKQLYSTHDNVRTKTIRGTCKHLPEVGHVFCMLAEPLDPTKLVRHFQTTKVKRTFVHYGEIYFDTQNSKYKLKKLWID